MRDEDHREIVAAMALEHRQELSRVHALLVAYRETLAAHGIEPPDLTGEMALERFRHVFHIAGHLDQLQHPELLADWWTKEREARDARAREEELSIARPH